MKKDKTSDILKKYGLTLQQETFCQHYVSPGEFYGNGTQAYIAAYDIDITIRGQYNAARVHAHNLLTNSNIIKRIDDLLETNGLNNNNVDKRLLHWINQFADPNVSMKAIQEYNKLRQRITEKVEHEIVTPVSGIRIIKVENGNKD